MATRKKVAWDLLSKIIRLENSDPNGYCTCVTCGTTKHWTELQAGHYIPKAQGNAVYFLEKNIHPQCVECNMFRGGNLKRYTAYMIETYGHEEVTHLYKTKNESIKISDSDYKNMIISFKYRLAQLM